MKAAPFPIPHRHGRTIQRQRQHGAALIVSMIMILLVLLLGVVAMRGVTMESRITANMLENQRLYEVADGTLREGERVILTHAYPLKKCDGVTTPVSTKTRTNGTITVTTQIPCFVSDAKADTLLLGTDFTTISAEYAELSSTDVSSAAMYSLV